MKIYQLGSVTLTATIISNCGNTSITLNKNIAVGFAPVKDSSVATTSCNGTYQTWMEYAVPVANATQWHWTKTVTPPNDIYIASPNSSSTAVDVSGGGTITLTYTDVCGNVKTDGATIL